MCIDTDEFRWAISTQYEKAVEFNADEALESIPFDISWSNKTYYDTKFIFSIKEIGEYIQKKI